MQYRILITVCTEIHEKRRNLLVWQYVDTSALRFGCYIKQALGT
jgi:hypothetical protein